MFKEREDRGQESHKQNNHNDYYKQGPHPLGDKQVYEADCLTDNDQENPD